MTITATAVPWIATPSEAPRAPETLRFDDLIFPLHRDEFLAEYWERKPFFASAQSAHMFRALFSSRDVDTFIHYQRPEPGGIDLVSDEGFVRDNFLNADGTANINLVYQSYLRA